MLLRLRCSLTARSSTASTSHFGSRTVVFTVSSFLLAGMHPSWHRSECNATPNLGMPRRRQPGAVTLPVMVPGWYDDPDPRLKGMQQRWWDGGRWTSECRPVAGTTRVSLTLAWGVLVVLFIVGVVLVMELNLAP